MLLLAFVYFQLKLAWVVHNEAAFLAGAMKKQKESKRNNETREMGWRTTGKTIFGMLRRSIITNYHAQLCIQIPDSRSSRSEIKLYWIVNFLFFWIQASNLDPYNQIMTACSI